MSNVTAKGKDSHVVVVEELENSISSKLKGVGLENSISSKLKGVGEDKTKAITIPKVHERLIKSDIEFIDSYEPRIISIGPYHRGNDKFVDMEMHKLRHVQAILSRNKSYCLMDYIRELGVLEMRARDCYSTNSIDFKKWQSQKSFVTSFVEMMLLDGCFIVEFLLRFKDIEKDELSTIIWKVPQIQYDLLLLENQLPFFVLERIFDLATTKEDRAKKTSLMKLALNYVCKMYSAVTDFPPDEISIDFGSESVHHLLHLYYLCFSQEIKRNSKSFDSSRIGFDFNVPSTEEDEKEIVSMIQSASALEEAGIKFKKKESSDILDVEFENGVMKIPPLLIDSFTMYQFRNLITFEQLCPGMEPLFTTYILFLNYLVNTCKDVALLHGEGIIEHLLGSDKEVARFFNKLTRATFRPSRHYLCRMYRKVHEYCNQRRHRWRVALVRNYFNSPWAVISVVAAIILLALTFVQTFFSVYSYARPPY